MTKRLSSALITLLLIGCYSCTHSHDGCFTIEENHEYGNGRELVFYETNRTQTDSSVQACTLLFHRFSGETDTLSTGTYNGHKLGMVGYIQRVGNLEKWLILETKIPSMILDSTYLVNDSIVSAYLGEFSYEGQAKVFDSKLSQFYIVNKYAPELYGPMNENEVKQQCQDLQIALPVTLEGRYDRYVVTHKTINGRLEKKPNTFSWPNWHMRENKVIQ